MTIKIIGSGIIGLSTGICLNLNGYQTEILTEDIPIESGEYKDKEGAATEYATASVKPSTIPNKNLSKMLESSIRIFDELSDKTNTCDIIPHFMGGKNFEHPEYKDILHNYKAQEESSFKFPFNPNSGGVFDVHYLYMDKYIPYLIGMYEETGGIIRKKKINDIEKLNNYDYLFNCSGYGSRELFGDTSLKPVRGHLAYVETGFQIEKEEYGGAFSYSYKPDNRKIYCYPQEERIILGKSAIHNSDEWESYDNYYKPDEGEKIPMHIIERNQKILKNTIGLDIKDYEIFGTSGYRPYREKGIRVEKEGEIIHNYGHGGSGATFSWGSAIKTANLIEKEDQTEKTINKIKEEINNYKPDYI